MNPKRLSLVSSAVLLAGLVSIWSGWQGNGKVMLGYPVTATSMQFCGSVSGMLAFLGLLGLSAGILLMIAAMIWSLVSE